MATKQRSKRRARPDKAAPKRRRPGLGAIGAGVAGLAALAAIVLAVLFSLGVVGGDDSAASQADKKLKAGQPVTAQDLADSIQASWKTTFAAEKKTWAPATITGGPTGDDPCQAPVAVYCDSNTTIYLEPEFMDRLRTRAGMQSQLAEAFVVAHLTGHHVQRELGITDKVEKGEKLHPDKAAKIGKARELEADCLAGFGLRGLVDEGVISTQGIERAMTAAGESGQALATDDPTDFNQETWHSTALKNRVTWFERGLRAPDVGACDTFAGLV
jgi:uncharacterized protein